VLRDIDKLFAWWSHLTADLSSGFQRQLDRIFLDSRVFEEDFPRNPTTRFQLLVVKRIFLVGQIGAALGYPRAFLFDLRVILPEL
jgi:hypothetical protein